MNLLKTFAVCLKIIQVALVVGYLVFGGFLARDWQNDKVTRFWSVSDPYLIPSDENYNLLSESIELQIGIKEQRFQNAMLKPVRLGVLLKSNDTAALFKLKMWAIALVSGFLLLIGIEQLRKMIISTQLGNPFNRLNTKRVYIIASLFLCYPILRYGQRWLISKWMDQQIHLVGLEWSLSINYELIYFLMGVFLVTIGKIMERGITFQEEQSLTV